MFEFIKKNKSLIGLLWFAVAMIYVFFPVLGKYMGLIAPDGMPFFGYQHQTSTLTNLLGGASFTPHTLYWLILNPLYAHELAFIIDSLFLTLAGVYYLRGRGVSSTAAWCGGLALGLSGYTFTLFCAGHRGYFHMFGAAVWAFGLLDRGFRTKKLFYFAMLGMIFAWGVGYQPDVLLLVGALAALYALWLTYVNGAGFTRTALKVWPRFLISVIFLVIAGFGGIQSALTTQVTNRKAQIFGTAASNGKKVDKAAKSEAELKAEKNTQWLFATNWSLPPEDMLEFVVPGIFGNESVYGTNPYWGRLGQPDKSVFQKGRMMPNYRQHSVYFGVVSVAFALFAVLVWLYTRKKAIDDAFDDKEIYRDLPFWIGVWVLCLLLAMGRFTPFYHLFYAIPYMDLIRAPVKFLHLVELASALLCGYGVHAFLSDKAYSVRLRTGFVWVAGSLAVFLVLTALVFMAGQSSITEHVKALGMGSAADGAAAYASKNIGRSLMLLVPVCIAAFLLCKKNKKLLLICFGYMVMALLVLDQSFVARRYVKAMDLIPFYNENSVVKALKKESVNGIPRVLSYAPRTQSDWFRYSLVNNGVICLEPPQSNEDEHYAQIFNALQKNPARLWQVLDVKYMILPYKIAGQLVRSGAAKPLLSFELGAGVVKQSIQASDENFILLSLNDVNVKPRLLTQWQGGLTVEDQIKQVTLATQILSDAENPSGPSVQSDAEVTVVFEQRIPDAYSIGVRSSALTEALLIFNQRVDDKYEILVDGQRAKKSVADGIWSAVKLLPGEHEIVLRKIRQPLPFVLSLLSFLTVIIWGGLRMFKVDRINLS